VEPENPAEVPGMTKAEIEARAEELYEQRLIRYKATVGTPNFMQKYKAIFKRRFIVFLREPRQWMLVVSPFINIFNIVMVFQGFENLVTATLPLDTTVSQSE
jgi:hypothetical protein